MGSRDWVILVKWNFLTQCWTTQWRPGEANRNVRQVDCTTWNHFWWFCLDALDDRSRLKKKKEKKKKVQATQSMNFNTNKNNEKRRIKMLKTNALFWLFCHFLIHTGPAYLYLKKSIIFHCSWLRYIFFKFFVDLCSDWAFPLDRRSINTHFLVAVPTKKFFCTATIWVICHLEKIVKSVPRKTDMI